MVKILSMDVQKAIVDVLRVFPFVKKVILFGSRARKDHRPRSDYDVAVDCPDARNEDWVDLVLAIEKIPTLLSIQLVCFNKVSTQLQERICKEGVTLYER